MSRRISLALTGLLVAGALGAVAPTQASSAGAIAGSCNLVQIHVQPPDSKGNQRLTTPGQGLCVVTEYNGLSVASNAGQISAQIEFTSPDVDVICSGSAARGFSGKVTVAIHGNDTDSFPDVTMIVDGAPGSQTLNPTATALIDGTRFAGAGTFTRSGSGSCGGTTTWTLGHITFEDPTLGGSGFPGS